MRNAKFQINYKTENSKFKYVCFLIIFTFFQFSLEAQELEPRSLTNLPVGTNFGLVGYRFAQGDVLLDPAIPIENLNARLHNIFAAYVRSINFFGMSGKISGILPYAFGKWDGYYTGIDTSTQRSGLGDPRINFAFNFIGSPAVKPKDYHTYHQKTIVGVNITTILPIGQYNPNKLLNLGSNRWTFKTQIGVSQNVKKWFFEVYGSIWFFTVNHSFFPDNRLEQYPFFAGKLHVIYSLPKRMWIAVDGGYGIGGRTVLNERKMDTRMSTFRFGLTFAVPITEHHAFKFILDSGRRLEKGPDFNSVIISYQYRWFDKQ